MHRLKCGGGKFAFSIAEQFENFYSHGVGLQNSRRRTPTGKGEVSLPVGGVRSEERKEKAPSTEHAYKNEKSHRKTKYVIVIKEHRMMLRKRIAIILAGSGMRPPL